MCLNKDLSFIPETYKSGGRNIYHDCQTQRYTTQSKVRGLKNTHHYNVTSTTYQIALFEGHWVSQENWMNDINALKTETYEIIKN